MQDGNVCVELLVVHSTPWVVALGGELGSAINAAPSPSVHVCGAPARAGGGATHPKAASDMYQWGGRSLCPERHSLSTPWVVALGGELGGATNTTHNLSVYAHSAPAGAGGGATRPKSRM